MNIGSVKEEEEKMKKFWSIAVILIVALFLTACSETTTTEAPQENNNASTSLGTNLTTPEDISSIAVIEAISAEWALTGHASTDGPLNSAGTRDGCQPCHSGNGFLQHLSDNPYTPQADEEAGEEVELPMTMDCATCHTGAGQEMLLTGVTEGYVPFVDGAYEAGKETALCISCHNGRRDTVDMYEQWASGEGQPTDYPHYDAGALYSGMGGIEYPDVEYANSVGHQLLGCVGCHMPETEEGYVSHNFSMDIADIEASCGSCHSNTSDFSVGGNLQAELDELLEELHDAAVAAVDGAAAIGMSRLTFPFVDAAGEPVDIEKVSKEAFVAAYNYYLVYSDKSGGAHNPKYAKSLLQESLWKLQ